MKKWKKSSAVFDGNSMMGLNKSTNNHYIYNSRVFDMADIINFNKNVKKRRTSKFYLFFSLFLSLSVSFNFLKLFCFLFWFCVVSCLFHSVAKYFWNQCPKNFQKTPHCKATNLVIINNDISWTAKCLEQINAG